MRSGDGARLELRSYQRAGHRPGSAVVYAHGGGQVLGAPDAYDTLLDWYTHHSGVPMFSVVVAWTLAGWWLGLTFVAAISGALKRD